MTTLDLASGYWQLEIDEADRYKTAFITRYGLFEHIRMGFGLCNAPATFSRAMQAVLHGLLWDTVLAYLDDVIVLGDSFDSHLHNLAVVFERFREHNLKLKPSKCSLIKTQVKFLGKIVSDKGISIDPGNTSKVQDWPEPRSVNEVEIFLGFMNYHREYIKTYADIAAPLYQLTGSRGKTKEFKWGIEHQVAFDHLKLAMTTAPVLGYPKGSEPFILDTDASDRAIGAELSQLQDGKYRVIGYGSFVLTPAQRRYCTTRKELLALVRFTRQYRHYLLGNQFYVRTDHNSLVWLLRFRNVQGQLARWLEELSQYDMVVLHRPEVKHTNADSLSRIPDPVPFCNCYTAGMNYSDLPCGGCNYCQRAHQQWGRFENDVDDIVPLAVRQVLTAEPDDGPESEGNVLPLLLPKTPVTVSNWLPTYSCEELRSGQMAVKYKLPLVIDVRDNGDGLASQDCLKILGEYLPQEQPIHRHRFVGSVMEMQNWLEAFPGTVFGFTAKILNGDHHPDLPEAVRTLPLEKLLLETDSPYLPLPDRTDCTPNILPEIAEAVGRIKHLPFPVVLESSRRAACKFYGLPSC